MFLKKLKYILFLLICSPVILGAQFYNKEVEAKINLEVIDNNILEIVGSASNKTEVNKSLRYVLSVIKKSDDSSNQSNNSQEGRLVLEPGFKKNLSTTAINIDNESRTIILLLIYDEEDGIIGKDRKILNGLEGEDDRVEGDGLTPENQDVASSKEDSFVLKGMVIENTKTKAGNDFYDLFYSSYLTRNINGEKVVEIKELLGIANTTQIQVMVGEEVVMQFVMNPRNQYLREMSEQAIYRVNLHFQQLKSRKNQIIRY